MPGWRNGLENWVDPADPGTWTAPRYGSEPQAEATEVEAVVVEPRVVEGLTVAAKDAHLFLGTDAKEMPIIELNEYGQPKTQPLPIVIQDQI